MHLPILISCFIYFLFPLLSSFPHLYHVFPIHCLTTTLLHQMQMATQSCSHVCSICTSSSLPLSFSMGLWNRQSAVNKADIIPAIASQTALSILGLTETWICPEDSATSTALSNKFSFSPPPPRQVRKGGGTDILISNNWKYSTYTLLCNNRISCCYCNGSGKTPCCSHLSPSWAIGHLPPSHSPRMAVHL